MAHKAERFYFAIWQKITGGFKFLASLLLCVTLSVTASFATEIRLLTGIQPPTNYLDDRGKLTGIAVDIIEELKKSLGVKAEIEVYPWARALKLAEDNPDIVLFTDAKTPERVAKGFHFIGPFVTRRHVIYSRAEGSTKLKNLKDIAGENARVVGTRGDWRTQLLKRRGAAIQETPDQLASVRMLLAGRADYWLSSDVELPLMLKSAGAGPETVDEAALISEASSYLLLSRGTKPAHVKAWQAAFKQLQSTGFLHRLAAKWSRKLGVNYAYSRSKGLYLRDAGETQFFSYSMCIPCRARLR